MGLKYIFDTNIVVYFLQQQFTPEAETFIDKILQHHQPIISAITEMELLCWKVAGKNDMEAIRNFLDKAIILEIDKPVKQNAVEVRRQYNLKLPDAIIAGTALSDNLTLLTKNVSDFGRITHLKWANPWQL